MQNGIPPHPPQLSKVAASLGLHPRPPIILAHLSVISRSSPVYYTQPVIFRPYWHLSLSCHSAHRVGHLGLSAVLELASRRFSPSLAEWSFRSHSTAVGSFPKPCPDTISTFPSSMLPYPLSFRPQVSPLDFFVLPSHVSLQFPSLICKHRRPKRDHPKYIRELAFL